MRPIVTPPLFTSLGYLCTKIRRGVTLSSDTLSKVWIFTCPVKSCLFEVKKCFCKNCGRDVSYEIVSALEWGFYFLAHAYSTMYKNCVKCVIIKFQTKARVSELRA